MINKTRSVLYRLARLLGDLQALRRGPTAVVKRVARKVILKQVGKSIR